MEILKDCKLVCKVPEGYRGGVFPDDEHKAVLIIATHPEKPPIIFKDGEWEELII